MQTPAPPASEQHAARSFWGWLAVWAGLFALLVLLAIGLDRSNDQPVARGDPAPAFNIITFDGEEYSLAGLQGKVIVLNFWASWCKPCEQEAADLQTAYETYAPRGDVVFLGAAYVDTEPESLAYLHRFGITYPNGPDLGQEIYHAYRASGVPETYFIGRDGLLAFVKIGPFTSLSEITSVIEGMLGE
jgi:cytochrome c biogenesis protein CcmG/thiol:disulfide interchange protein DsbE